MPPCLLSELDCVTVAQLRAGLDAGALTSRAIVEAHLARIARFDPAFGAIRCLAALGTGAPVRSLAEIRAWNLAHAQAALKFGQVHVDIAVAIDHERDRDAYRQARERDLHNTNGGLRDALGDELECLVFPRADGASLAARAGWPSIVIPAGYTADSRRPVGLILVGRLWTDARLLALAYAFEQAHPVRRRPSEINPAVFGRI